MSEEQLMAIVDAVHRTIEAKRRSRFSPTDLYEASAKNDGGATTFNVSLAGVNNGVHITILIQHNDLSLLAGLRRALDGVVKHHRLHGARLVTDNQSITFNFLL